MDEIENHLEEVPESLSQSSPRGSYRGSDYFTTTEDSSPGSSSQFETALEGMSLAEQNRQVISVEDRIEQSKSHWSSLAESESDDDEVAEIINVYEFEVLRRHPQWGFFFQRFGKGTGRSLVVGEMFAEGGQAELYEVAHVNWCNPALNERDVEKGIKYALKVFKKGTKLRQLKRQWPLGYLQFRAENWKYYEKHGKSLHKWRFWCNVICRTLLEDGRFAFVMMRETEDLRSLINCQMALRTGQDCGFTGLFPKWRVENMMYKIAKGMAWLHNRNIIHRDLKASNVFLCKWHRRL